MKKTISFITLATVLIMVVCACTLCFAGCNTTKAVEVQAIQAERVNLSLNGVAEATDSTSVLLTFTVEPSYVYDKTVSWSLEWEDPNSSFAQGKSPNAYLSVTPRSGGAEVSCLAPFGTRIKVIATSNATASVSAYCVFGYGERMSSFDLQFMGYTNPPSEFPYKNGFPDDYDCHVDWNPRDDFGLLQPICDSTLVEGSGSIGGNAESCNFVHDGAYTNAATTTTIEYAVSCSYDFARFLNAEGFNSADETNSVTLRSLDYAGLLEALTGEQYWSSYANGNLSGNQRDEVEQAIIRFNRAVGVWCGKFLDAERAVDHCCSVGWGSSYLDQGDYDLYTIPPVEITVTYTNEYCTVVKKYGFLFNFNHPLFNATAVSLSESSIVF